VKALFVTLTLALLLTGCSRNGEVVAGGVYVKRTGCPQVAIPAATGDITLFDPPGYTTAAAIDVTAAITNLRSTCTEEGAFLVSTASYDVVATRRDAAQARQVVLPIFSVATQGGTNVVAKRIGGVALDFAAGSIRGQGRGQSVVRVARASAALPADVQRELTRQRKPGDADAAVDPLSDPKIRDAVAAATFEHLVGFQLSQEQLRYNATR
jgi:outer membrane lipoprotein SlyB